MHFQLFKVYEIRVESNDGVENERLKHQFSQMKGDLYLQNLDPKPLNTLFVPIRKKMFFFKNVKKDPIQGSIWFKLVLGLFALGPLSKMAFKCSLIDLLTFIFGTIGKTPK